MGSSEVYPQIIKHSPNGRFVAVCGDGEFSIYTAMALRNKAFGGGLEFVWSNDSAVYAVREQSAIKIFKNFKEKCAIKPEMGFDGMLFYWFIRVLTPLISDLPATREFFSD